MLEAVLQLKAWNPRLSPLALAGKLGVCPTGLIDPEDWELLALEGSVREYGAGYLAVYGYDPAPARVLEALDVIRQTRNEIDARKFRDMKKGADGG